jgi:hypothetical protein
MGLNHAKYMISLAVVCMTLLLFSTSPWPQLEPVYAQQLSAQSAIKLLASSSDPSPFFLPPLSSSSSQTNSTNSATAGSEVKILPYENSTFGIKVHYPSNWIKQESQNRSSNDIVKFNSPVGAGPASLDIIGGKPVPQNISLEQYNNASINALSRSFPGFNITESNATTLAGIPAHKIVYTAIIPTSGLELKFMQIFTIKDGKDYVITSAALTTDFSTYLPTFQKMIDSFAFVPLTTPSSSASLQATNATTARVTTTALSNQTGPPSVANRTASTPLSNRTSLSSMLPFMNNLFNGSSLSGIVGISSVNGVKVTGVNLGNNEISVTLRHILTTGINNVSSVPPSVTVTVIRLPTNLQDLMSLAAASGNNTSTMMANNANPVNTMIGQGFSGVGANATTQNNPLKALALLKNIQIGSSSILNADWRLPQTTTMGLIGASNGSSSNSTADFVIVTVVPFTGKTNNLTG